VNANIEGVQYNWKGTMINTPVFYGNGDDNYFTQSTYPAYITFDFKQEVLFNEMLITFWHYDDRTYTWNMDYTEDGINWLNIV
jgi:hypothetical protein